MGVAVGTVEQVTFYPAQSGMLFPGPVETLGAGCCCWIDPYGGDIHRVGASGGKTAISIHVYGTRFDRVCRNRYRADGTVIS